jgi:hypothetical protein
MKVPIRKGEMGNLLEKQEIEAQKQAEDKKQEQKERFPSHPENDDGTYH